jgi:hypothetical protein
MGNIRSKKTEGGQGGKRGHSNMTHWEFTEDIKDESRILRRRVARLEVNEQLADFPTSAKPIGSGFRPIRETLTEGWQFGSYTRYASPDGCSDGDGFVIAPDGQRAELDWYVGTGKLKRTSKSDQRIWGCFEIGFPHPVKNKMDLVANFRAVLPQIKSAFARHQKRRLAI